MLRKLLTCYKETTEMQAIEETIHPEEIFFMGSN